MKFRLEFGVVLAVCILGLLPNLAFAASPSCPALSANLAQGSTGPEVTALQEYLAEYPTVYPQGIISAYYGSLTTAAVERFQALHGIVSSGSPYTTGYGALGPRTRAAIESSCGTPPPPPPQNSCPTFIEPLGPGSTGEGVSTLQSFLGRFPALYPEDLTSGYYGSLTTAAVERFQTLENVVSSGSPYTTGYGAVGPRTAAALATYCAETTVSTSTPEGNNTSGSGGGGGGGGTQGGGQEDTIPPSVPQNLQASPTEGQVFLSWSPSTDNVGVQGYYVYRDGAEIANVGGTVYTDTNVTDGDTYTYTVAAYDYSGNVSGLSSPVNATVPSGGGGGQAPSAPANLTASSTVDTVSLSWDASTGGEGGVAGYQIYRNDTEVGSATTTSYTDTAVTPNTAYEYYVTAYDEDGDVSSPSNTEDIQTAADSEPPTTPQDLTVTGTTVSTASLSWQASTDPLGIPIGGYTVYRDGTAVASTTSTTYTDSGLAPSTTYTYTVSAYDEFDTASPQSPPAYATTQANGPSAPTNLASSNITSSSLTLSWSASTETDGTIAGYDVYRNEVKIATVTSTFYNDSGLSPGTMYEYTVDAFDTSGNYSPQSSPLYVTTLQSQGTGPTVPQGLEVTGTTTSSISLAWDASTDEDGTIEGYNVFRNGTAIATTSQTEYTDTGLSEGTTYSYTVDAYDNNGYYSAQSGAVQGTTGGGGPVERLSVKGQQILDPSGNPIDLTGFVWGNLSYLSLSDPNDAADNASQGANIVRVPLRWWGDYGPGVDSYDPDSPQTGYINPTNLSALDQAIQLATENHLWVDLFMESDCGADSQGKMKDPDQTCGENSDGSPNNFENDPAMLAEFTDAWQYLAAHYEDTSGIGMYELLSEPGFGSCSKSQQACTFTMDLYTGLINVVHAIDPSTPFLIAADGSYDADFSLSKTSYIATTTPIIYTADMLENGDSRHPEYVGDNFVPFMQKYNVPFYVQQAGIASGDEDVATATPNLLSTLDGENSTYNPTNTKIGWTWWDYRTANDPDNNAVWYTDANGNWVEKTTWLATIDQYFSGDSGNQCGDEPKQPQVPQFTLNLTVGSTGSEVTALQKLLGVTQSGYYGALTEAAVEKFQASHNIVYSGSPLTTGYGALGPKTREALNESGPQTGSGGGSTCGPTVPQGLEVTGTTTSSISLAWQASTDNEGSITGYNVFRNGTAIATTTTTAYTDTGLSEGTSYSYTVDAYDNLGNYSAQSGAVEGTTGGGGNMDSTFLGNYLPSGVTITQFESTIGHSIQIENQGESFGTDWGTDSKRAGEEPTDIKDGVIPMISLKLDGSLAGGASSCVTLQEIIDGDFDGTAAQDYGYTDKQGNFHPGLIEMAQAFASWKTPILIRFFKEFTDDQIDKCAYGVAKPADDPQVYGPLFVAAWQHVVNIFKENGATNVEWIWGPSAGLFANEDGSPDNVAWQYFYPGNNYVDWVSDDNYDKSNTTIEDFNADSSIIDWYSLIQQTGKPMMQAETGAGYNAGLQPNDPMNVWLSSAYAALTGATTTNPMPDIRAFLWWGASGTNDYVLQGAGLTTYADMAADSYFGAATSSISQYFSSTGSASGPSTPANLIGTPVGDAIDLSWSASTDNNGTISYYDIYRTLGATTTEIATTTSSSYTDSNVTNGTSYGYLIDAIDNNLNRSLQSTEIQVTAGGNSCNDGGKVYGGSQFTLNLTLGSTGPEVTALQKLLGVTQSGYYGALTEAAVEKFQASHNIVYSGSPLTTGYGALGPKTREALNESGPQTGSGGGSTCGPTVPQGLEVTGTTTSSISLAWQASTDNEGSITGYNVFRNGTAIATTTTTAYTDTGLSEGTSYSYTVDAYDNLGNYSAQSGAVEGTTGGGGDGGTVLIGLHGSQSDIDAIEKDMGRPPAIQYAYYSISSNFSTSSSPAVQEIANGSIPMINWIPHEAGNTNSKDYCGGVTATNILSGMFDGPNINPYTGNQNPGFYAQAEEIKSLGVPVIVGWFGQMTDSIPDTCFYTTNVGDVSVAGPEYVAAYRHIVSIFKDVGATNVQFVWPPAATLMSKGSNTCDLNGQKNLPDWECFYPGNAWVDWIGNDHYNKSSSVSDYDQDSDIINWYNAVAPLGKPLMQRQTGAIATSTETPDPQSEWVTTAHTSINPSLASSTENTFPAIKVFSYNDSNSQANGQILQNLGSNKGLTDFIDLADDPYFGATSVNQYFSSTGGDPDNIGTPSNLNVTGETNSSISISWSPSTDEYPINGYDIFRDGEIIGEATTSTSYTDTGLSEGTTYSYTVEAYDENGYYSAQSSAVQQGTLGGNQCGGNNDNQGGSLFTQNLGLGSTGVQVTALQKLLGVTQSGYYGALTEAAVEKFQASHNIVYSGSPLTTGYGALGPKTREALNESGPQTGSGGGSTCGPTVPQGLEVTGTTTSSISLAWQASTDNEGSITGYNVFRNGTAIATTTTTAYTDTGLSEGTSYSYTVDAYDNNGYYSAQSGAIYGTTGVEEGGTPTVLIGAHVDLSSVPETQRRSDFITLGNEIGRPLAIDSEYADFYNLASSTITSRIAWDEQNGLIPMLSWRNEFYDGNKGEQAGNCADAADIASGAYDSALIQEADAIKALGEPVLIRWRYEFDDYASMPCFYNFDSKLTDAEEGAEYVASFEHIFNIFQEQGATNVQWIWAPTSTLFSENGENDDIDWQYFYPTNNYVDWIAVDNYNHDDTLKAFYDDGSGLPYDSDIADFYNDVEGSTTNVKPLMLSETAACNDPAQYPTDPQTEWIETIESGMEKAFPAFHAFIWWDTQGNGGNCDQGDNGNYDGNAYWLGTEPLGGSTPGLAAYTTLAQDPYFQLPTSDISNFFSSGNNSGKANSPVSPSAGSCPLLSTTLTLGAKNATTGGQVSVLQRILSKVFPTASVTGYFGTLTESLVKEFQASHGIISYGSPLTTGYGAVGPKTRTALEAACLLTQSTASSTVLTLLTNTTTTATTTVSTTTTTTKTDTTPPSIPQGLIASVISSGTPGVRLSWSPATDNVAVAGYYIYRSGSLLTSATTTSYIDTTMRSDSTYVYTVRAYDAAGNVSAASNGVSITAPYIPDTTPPSAPSNLTASVELKGGSGPGVGTNYAIVLSWSPATDNVGVAGYDIYRATGNTFATLTLLTSVSSLTYTDASVSPGTTYYYTVKAYDAAGNISGASNEASGSF